MKWKNEIYRAALTERAKGSKKKEGITNERTKLKAKKIYRDRLTKERIYRAALTERAKGSKKKKELERNKRTNERNEMKERNLLWPP